jgi:NAD(P)H-nitrite reductase large subunit
MDQARHAAETILADHHRRTAGRSRRPPRLLRLRSHGIPGVDAAVLVAGPRAQEPALCFTDQHRRTHKAVSLEEDSVIGATLIGDVGPAAAISRLLAWPEPQPVIPAALLTSRMGGSEATLGSR